MLIKGDCNHLVRDSFTLCHAHCFLLVENDRTSSIMSWNGDCSHIHDLNL